MAIRVALHHKTIYEYDRLVRLSPQVVRLRPAPHRGTPPTIPIHTPLVLDLVDLGAARSLGGCSYHVAHPGGRNYETFPVNSNEGEARRRARFFARGHTPGKMQIPPLAENPDFPAALDLRCAPGNA